jgi:RNA polymerase sigma-70 factor, ECF subfamily
MNHVAVHAGVATRLDGNSAAASRPTDADLLSRHVGGDPDAFGLLFGRHRDRLWAVAIRTLGDPEEAADALQDAMISAFRRAASFRGDSAVTTWLHRIVVNACLDRMRRKSARLAATSGDEGVLDGLASGGPLPDPSAATDTAIDVMTELRTLVPEQQAALVLVDMLGYPVSDAAEVLGVSEGTVKSRCARGRARLLPKLAHVRPPPIPSQDRRSRSAGPHVLPAQEGVKTHNDLARQRRGHRQPCHEQPAAEEARVASHLSGCPQCNAISGQLNNISSHRHIIVRAASFHIGHSRA